MLTGVAYEMESKPLIDKYVCEFSSRGANIQQQTLINSCSEMCIVYEDETDFSFSSLL